MVGPGVAAIWCFEAQALFPPVRVLLLLGSFFVALLASVFRLGHRRTLLSLLALGALLGGAVAGQQSLSAAYNGACLPLEGTRQAVLDLESQTGSLPAHIDILDVELGRRLLHPPLVRFARRGRDFTLTCSDGFITWTATRTEPTRPSK